MRLGKREREAKKARLAAEEETKKQLGVERKLARAWGKSKSALQRLYDQPINRQAAKALSRVNPRIDR